MIFYLSFIHVSITCDSQLLLWLFLLLLCIWKRRCTRKNAIDFIIFIEKTPQLYAQLHVQWCSILMIQIDHVQHDILWKLPHWIVLAFFPLIFIEEMWWLKIKENILFCATTLTTPNSGLFFLKKNQVLFKFI